MAKTWRERRELAKLKAVPVVKELAKGFPGGSFADSVDARPSLFHFLEASLVSLPSNAEAVTKHIEKAHRRSTIPALVTASQLGDATGFTSANREWVYGWNLNGKAVGTDWLVRRYAGQNFVHRMPGGWDGEPYMIVDNLRHPLGASYLLDCHAIGLNLNPYRMGYSGVGEGGHRARVAWSGGGDVCVSDECEGWDAIFVNCGTDETAAQLARWRGGRRVWVSFGFTMTDEERLTPEWKFDAEGTGFLWSGAAGYSGEPYRMFSHEVLTGNMPSRAFIEWLCERFALPGCVAPIARRCNFVTEKN